MYLQNGEDLNKTNFLFCQLFSIGKNCSILLSRKHIHDKFLKTVCSKYAWNYEGCCEHLGISGKEEYPVLPAQQNLERYGGLENADCVGN
jgi:hypothetical protein